MSTLYLDVVRLNPNFLKKRRTRQEVKRVRPVVSNFRRKKRVVSGFKFIMSKSWSFSYPFSLLPSVLVSGSFSLYLSSVSDSNRFSETVLTANSEPTPSALTLSFPLTSIIYHTFRNKSTLCLDVVRLNPKFQKNRGRVFLFLYSSGLAHAVSAEPHITRLRGLGVEPHVTAAVLMRVEPSFCEGVKLLDQLAALSAAAENVKTTGEVDVEIRHRNTSSERAPLLSPPSSSMVLVYHTINTLSTIHSDVIRLNHAPISKC